MSARVAAALTMRQEASGLRAAPISFLTAREKNPDSDAHDQKYDGQQTFSCRMFWFVFSSSTLHKLSGRLVTEVVVLHEFALLSDRMCKRPAPRLCKFGQFLPVFNERIELSICFPPHKGMSLTLVLWPIY